MRKEAKKEGIGEWFDPSTISQMEERREVIVKIILKQRTDNVF